MGPPPPDPESVRDAAREVLSRPEYQEPEPSLLDRAVDWFFDRLSETVATLTGGGPGAVIGWLVVVTMVGGAVWLIVRALGVASVPIGARRPEVVYGTESRPDADTWRAEYRRLRAEGDLRGALRCRFQAASAALVESGTMGEAVSRTPAEQRAELVVAVPEIADVVTFVTEGFERAWYGGGVVSAAALDEYVAACDELERAGAGRGARGEVPA